MSRTRIPIAAGDIQVNFCKNPLCKYFGVPAGEEHVPKGRSANLRRNDPYTISGGGNGIQTLKCHGCNEFPPIKSNHGIREELDRMTRYLIPAKTPSCPDPSCPNHTVPITEKKAYYRFGSTKSGSKRYRCRLCQQTFSVGRSTLRHKKPEKNEEIFNLLVNKSVFKRMCNIADVRINTIYGKIDFLYRQCQAFAGSIEMELPNLKLPELFISVDRQDYLVNWTRAGNKKNVQLSSIGSADNESGFVFGMHLNYDETINPYNLEDDVEACGDYKVPPAFRQHARLWLKKDYELSLLTGSKKRSIGTSLGTSIRDTYAELSVRDDVESPDTPSVYNDLPEYGVQVHAEYTLYGHFFFLRKMLGGVGKVRFYLDQESGIRAACLAAFRDEIMAKTCDAFYVKIEKDLTVNQKYALCGKSNAALEEFRESSEAYRDLLDSEIRHLMIIEEMQNLVAIGKWRDRWLQYPFPTMTEPLKAVCWLTDIGDRYYSDDDLADLYGSASLHGIDRFFMQVRRKISPLERPVSSSSSGNRRWYGYAPYNPALIIKLLEIFRVYYNYVQLGEDKRTPAMRLGLLDREVTLREIIDFAT